MSGGPSRSFAPSPETLHAASRLQRHIDWGRGFWLAFVFTKSPPQAHILQRRLQRALEGREGESRTQRILRPGTPVELGRTLRQLLDGDAAGCTWIEAVRGGTVDGPAWTDAWVRLILRANERRELIRDRLAGGLVFVAHPDLKPELRRAGPDLWSIRNFVFELPAGAELEDSRLDGAELASEGLEERFEGVLPSFVDPVLLDEDVRRSRDLLEYEGLAEQARTKERLAERLSAAGRFEKAAETSAEVVAMYRVLASQDPAAFEPELAQALSNLAVSFVQLDSHREAHRASEEATYILERLVYDQPAEERSEELLPEFARALSTLATAASRMGRLSDALESDRRAVSIRRGLAEERPQDFLSDLAGSLNNLGNRLSIVGQHEEALDAMAEAVEIRRGLVEERPGELLPDFAASLNNLGKMLGDLGRREEALRITQESVDVRRALVEDQPESFLPSLAYSLNSLGIRLSEVGQLEDARQTSREAVELYRELAEKKPDVYAPDLARSLTNLGNRLGELRRHEEALEVAEQSVAILRQLADEQPEVYLGDLAHGLNNLGIQLAHRDRPDEALLVTQEAVSIHRVAAEQNPSGTLPDLAGALSNLGNRLSDLGKTEEALEVTREAVEFCRTLAEQRPHEMSSNLARVLGNFGADLWRASHGEEALEALDESVGIYQRLADESPGAFRSGLARVLGLRGVVQTAMGEHAKALKSFAEGLRAIHPVLAEFPETFQPLTEEIQKGIVMASRAADLPLPDDIKVLLPAAIADA